MKRRQSNALLALIALFSLFFNSVSNVAAQIGGAAGEDISEGASVFVFRASSPKSALRAQTLKARPLQKKIEARERRVQQSNLLGSTRRPKNPPVQRPTPKPVKSDTGRLALEKSAENYAQKGEAAFNNKDLDEAENLYSEARAINPDNQTARLGLAKVYAARGDAAYEAKSYRSAALSFNQSIALNPENADVYAALGETYEAQDQNDKAIEAYLNALRLDDSLTEINAPLGTLYYEKANVSGENIDASTQKANFATAEKYLAKSVAVNSKDDDLQNKYGEVLLKLDRNEEAARAFQTAIGLNQNNAAAHYNLAKTLVQNNRPDEAIAELQKAIKADTNYGEAYFDLGTLLFNKRQYDEAAKNFQEVLRVNSSNAEARVNLADTLRLLEKYPQAADQYQIAAPLMKKPEIYSDFGYVLGKTRNWTRAIEMLKESVKLDPNAYDYTNLAWAYNNAAVATKNPALFEEAKRAAQEAVRLNPNFAPAYYNLGNAQAQSKDFQGAFQSYEQALKLRKNWAEANNNLGFAYATSGNHDRAIEEYRKALKMKPQSPETRYNLGVSLALSNKFSDAENEMRELSRYDQARAQNLAVVIRAEKRKRGIK